MKKTGIHKKTGEEVILGSANRMVHAKDLSNQRAQEMIHFLADASNELSKSLDFNITLDKIAKLVVPKLAYWYSIDVLDENNKLQLLTLEHKDPKKVIWAKKLRERQPVDMSEKQGLPNVVRTGKSELYKEISDEMLVSSAKNKQQLRLLRKLDLTSVMIVPLIAREKILGAISFITTSESDRHYDDIDLAFAEDLACRIAMAIENAQLLENARNELRERKVMQSETKKLLQERDALLNSTSSGIFEADMHGNCMFINKTGLKMLGYTANEVVGKNMHTLTHHHRVNGSAYLKKDCPLYSAYDIGHEVYIDNDAIWKKNNSMIPVEYRANAIKVDGIIVGTVVGVYDNYLTQARAQKKNEFLIINSQ